MKSKHKPSVCVIGAGPGGGVLAMELAKSEKVDVIVVDVDQIDANYQQASSIELESKYSGQPFGLEYTRGFGFGGSSNLWHGLVTQLDSSDWDSIDKLAGTQISAEVKECYLQLNDYFPRVSDAFTSLKLPITKISNLYNELMIGTKFQRKDFLLQKKPLRIRDLLNKAAKKHNNLRFVENAIALYFVPKSDCQDVAEQLIVNQDGNIISIEADYFVVSTGALETPRLCKQSISNGFDSIKNENMGRFLTDHPWGVIGELISKRGRFRLSVTDKSVTKGLLHRIGLLPKIIESDPFLTSYSNHGLALKPLHFGVYNDFREILKSLISTQLSVANMVKLLAKYKLRDLLGCITLLAKEKSSIGAYVNRALVFCYLEQAPCKESGVSLTTMSDEYGRSIPEINWVFKDMDLKQASKVSQYMHDSFSSSEAFYFKPYDLKMSSFASGAHHAGTMKIGSDSKSGVVDSNLKIFGSENIYVCDLSIFPRYGNSNPTLTLCAFAVRLSQHLMQRVD